MHYNKLPKGKYPLLNELFAFCVGKNIWDTRCQTTGASREVIKIMIDDTTIVNDGDEDKDDDNGDDKEEKDEEEKSE